MFQRNCQHGLEWPSLGDGLLWPQADPARLASSTQERELCSACGTNARLNSRSARLDSGRMFLPTHSRHSEPVFGTHPVGLTRVPPCELGSPHAPLARAGAHGARLQRQVSEIHAQTAKQRASNLTGPMVSLIDGMPNWVPGGCTCISDPVGVPDPLAASA